MLQGDILAADLINRKVSELREKEVLLKNFIIIEQNQREVG